jgi:hypothetical protein
MRFNRNYVLAATVGAVAIGGFAPLAFGSTGSGLTSTVLVTANFDDAVHLNRGGVKFQTKDPTDVRVQQFVFSAGANSGWHHHPGLVLIAVQSGSVTFWDSQCNTKTYGPGLPNGAVLIDGDDTPGRVTSTDGATTYVTYVVPKASTPVFRIEDDPPPCA